LKTFIMTNFMILPRELRDQIYGYALTQDRIVISPTPLNDTSVCRRTQWRDYWNRAQSYHFQRQGDCQIPNLNLLLVSRRVHAESSAIFYKQNAFAFFESTCRTSPESTITAALAFLYDRPQEMIQQVQEIHLKLGRSPFDHVWRYMDYGIWNNLCDELSRNLKLERLTLHIEGDFCDIVAENSCERWEFQSAWGQGLYQISGLRNLEVKTSNKHTLEENLVLVNCLRAWMMKDGVPLISVDTTLKRKAFADTEHHKWYNVFVFGRQ